MAGAKRGSSSSGGAAGTSWSPTLPQVPLPGSLLIVVFGYSKASNGGITYGGTIPTGWTLAGSVQVNSGLLAGGAAVWMKVAGGTELTTGHTITSTASVTATWTVEEITGLDLTDLPEGPTIPYAFTSTNNITTAQNINSNTRLAVEATEFLFTFGAGRSTAGAISQSFSGGATASYVTNSGRAGYAYTANEAGVASGASRTHVFNCTNGAGNNVNVVGTLAFKEVPAYTPKFKSPIVSGVKKTVTSDSVIVGGVKKAISSVSLIVGGVKKPVP